MDTEYLIPFSFISWRSILLTDAGNASCALHLISSVFFSYGLNKSFLVPDSYEATERNSNSISANVTCDANEND